MCKACNPFPCLPGKAAKANLVCWHCFFIALNPQAYNEGKNAVSHTSHCVNWPPFRTIVPLLTTFIHMSDCRWPNNSPSRHALTF